MKSFPDILKTIFVSDIKAKLMAIVIASLLWYFVNILSLEKVYISLPVVLENIPDSKDVSALEKELAVRIEISTYEDVSRRVEDVMAYIDLSNYQLGINKYPIELRNFPNDLNIKLIPAEKEIAIYDIVTNSVVVNARVKPNRSLTNVRVTPSRVEILGATKDISNVNSVNTVNVDYNNIPISNHIVTNITLIVPQGVKILNHRTVDVELFFNQTLYTNQVYLPLEYKNLSTNLRVAEIDALMLNIVTTTTNIEALLLQTVLDVDLKGLDAEGVYNLELGIQAPIDVLVLDAPTEIQVVLSDILANNDVDQLLNRALEASLEGIGTNNQVSLDVVSNDSNTTDSVETEQD